jgi:hypothetical protein
VMAINPGCSPLAEDKSGVKPSIGPEPWKFIFLFSMSDVFSDDDIHDEWNDHL